MGYLYIYTYISQKLQFAAYGQFFLVINRMTNIRNFLV